ncbi:hypothetical protein H5410_045293 [Solanum commersonii]|uniref:Uncharacterized protein n=1 Tax=Solanum commersonii TaxID=4109 RepID=A0A9J5X983_SOLCO|nr:hypothetical protein H5410_045293 [Solanum commersonii]
MKGRDYNKRGENPRDSNPCSSQFSLIESKAHNKGSSIVAWRLEFACIRFHSLSWIVRLVPKVVRPIMAVSNLRLFYDMGSLSGPGYFKGELDLGMSLYVIMWDICIWGEYNHSMNDNLDNSVQMMPQMSTQIWIEKVIGGHTRNDLQPLQSSIEGIRSSHIVKALDIVQIVAMLDQIAKLTVAHTKFEQRGVVEQESMSVTIQQIKEQDTNDESEEDDDNFIDCTP